MSPDIINTFLTFRNILKKMKSKRAIVSYNQYDEINSIYTILEMNKLNMFFGALIN